MPGAAAVLADDVVVTVGDSQVDVACSSSVAVVGSALCGSVGVSITSALTIGNVNEQEIYK